MKIILFNTGYPNENNPASGIFTHRTVQALSRRVEVIVVHLRAFNFKRKICKKEELDGIIVYRMAIPQVPHLNKPFLMRFNIWLYSLLGYFFLPKELKQGNAFHSTGLIKTGLIVDFWAKNLNKKHIVQGIGDDINIYLTRLIRSKSWKKRVEALQCVHFNSMALQKAYKQLIKTSKQLLFVNYRGVDLTAFSAKNQYNHTQNLSFLYLGGIQSYDKEQQVHLNTKGGHILMKAWQAFEKKRPHVKLLFGGPGNDEKQLEEWKQSLKHPQNITVKGRLSPEIVSQYIQKCDVVIIPSINEGLPNLANEAGACGTPVLGTNAGGIPERVLHRKTGYIVQKNSIEELAEGLEWFYDNFETIPNLGQQARQFIAKEVSWEKFVEKLLTAFSKI